MGTVRKTTLALLAVLLAFTASAWERIKYETRHWPSVWNIAAAAIGAITAGLIMLHSVDLLDDFLKLIL